MRSGFRIGTVFGIDVRVDWSWLLIFLLVTWNLSTLFGNAHPGWSVGLQWGLAVVAALLFFGSVLAHELAHSLFARSRGVPVSGITLFLFGGVSNIQRDPDSPAGEFWMAILGPITSLVIGGVLLLVGSLIAGTQTLSGSPEEMLSELQPVTTLVLWLGSVNVSVGLFNLIPGFPLDGGRVLRSILWGITDDLRRATRWATWVGQAIAWAMIVAGISMAFGVQLPVLGEGVVSGIWLAFIGWFLNNASTQSYRKVVVEDVLKGVPVSRMMRSNPPCVTSDITIDELVHEHIMGTDDQSFPVVDDGELVGLVTLEDVRGVPRDRWKARTVREAMTPREDLVTVSADGDAAQAMNDLAQTDVRQLPVLRGEQLVGLLRRRDIIRWLQLESELSIV